MSTCQEIIPIADKILKKYDLCNHCLGRLFSKQLHLSSNKVLEKKLKKKVGFSKKCYVCKNSFENLNYFLKLMIDASSNYYFTTFSVGAMIKPSIMDRDDFIRSKFKLKGIDSIKTDITKELGNLFSRKTKKIIDSINPETTFTVNFKDESCQLRSKSITISGRYVKSQRGFPQKQKSCDNCSGKGCRICNFHGITKYDSIEGVISKLIFKKFGGTTAKFTWIGGEDQSSLVLGTGRPFFVKIQNPLKRKVKLSSTTINSINLSNLKLVYESPKKPLKFISVIKIIISTKTSIDSEHLKKLKNLTLNPIVVYEKAVKRSEKKIFQVKYKKISKDTFALTIKVEGGLPIKRFVVGDDVTPGISKILDASCVCRAFDFLEVEV